MNVTGNVTVTGQVTQAGSYMRRSNGLTKGSTNTQVIIYGTAEESAGSDITYQNNATRGDSFLINTNGIYSISVSAGRVASQTMQICVGSVQNNYHTSNARATQGEGDLNYISTAWTGYITAAQEVYVLFSDVTPDNAELNQITIAKVG